MRFTCFFLAVCSFVFSVGSSKEPAKESIVYSSIQPGNWNLYAFNNTVARQITKSRFLDYNPVYSPDGRFIVFTSERMGTAHLYLLDVEDGSKEAVRLTESQHFEDQATFSPDGRKLYFVSSRDGLSDIFEVLFEPGRQVPEGEWKSLTHQMGSSLHPAVSPDGQWIAFSSDRGAMPTLITSPMPPDNYKATDLYLMKSDGTDVCRLTDHPEWDGSPVFSPDGRGIYFYSTREGNPRIYRLDLTDNHVAPVSHPLISALSPTIKLGGRLAFAAHIFGRWIIVSTKLDGSDLQYESDTRLDYAAPKFHPLTGELITYARSVSEEPEFLDELPGGLFGDVQYMNKPMAVGPFFITESQREFEGKLVDIYAVRGYFPDYNPEKKQLASVKAFQEVVLSSLKGEQMRSLFRAPEGAFIGLSVSADGEKIVVASGVPFAKPDAKVDLWLFQREGEEARNITQAIPGNAAFPRFMPNGEQVVFRYGRAGYKNLYSINIDGSRLTQLTDTKGIDTMPDVSKDGKKIVYTSQVDKENYNLYLLTLGDDGLPVKKEQLTDSPTADVHPAFSPDGEWVIFSSERGGLLDETPLIPVFSPQPYGDLYAIRIKDKKVIRLTSAKWENSLPNWR